LAVNLSDAFTFQEKPQVGEGAEAEGGDKTIPEREDVALADPVAEVPVGDAAARDA